jgi:hypothetical protein
MIELKCLIRIADTLLISFDGPFQSVHRVFRTTHADAISVVVDKRFVLIERGDVMAEVELGIFTPGENVEITPYHRTTIKYSSPEFFLIINKQSYLLSFNLITLFYKVNIKSSP